MIFVLPWPGFVRLAPYADDGAVDDARVRQQDGLELGRRDLEATDFE